MTTDPTRLLALTLVNPWAHLVIHAGKTIENRTWTAPATLDRFLLHAGKAWDDDVADRYQVDREQVATGAIVAVVDVDGVCSDSLNSTPATLDCRCSPRWAMPRQYHWRLGAVTVLDEPVPCRGQLLLWRPPEPVMSAVVAQLAVTR